MNGEGAGKGDSPRRCLVTQKEYSDNWERIFGKKSKEKDELREEYDFTKLKRVQREKKK